LVSGVTTISKTIFTSNAFIFKNIFFRTRRPNSINHGPNYLLVKGILNYIDKWPGLLQREDNHKNEVGSFKEFLPKEKSLDLNESSSLNHGPWGPVRITVGKTISTCVYIIWGKLAIMTQVSDVALGPLVLCS
jgi:hypothetical protein